MSIYSRPLVSVAIFVASVVGFNVAQAQSHTAHSSLGVSFNVALNGPADAQARYVEDVNKCNSGQSQQDKATCLKEAGAALQQANAGQLTAGQPKGIDELKANEVARCQNLPESDRRACIARANGAGVKEGSVNGGGIIRETVEVIPPGATQGAIK